MTYNLQLTPMELRLLQRVVSYAQYGWHDYEFCDVFSANEKGRIAVIEKRIDDLITNTKESKYDRISNL